MTKRHVTPMYYAAKGKRRKEVAMSPTQEQIKIPEGLRLEHRRVCGPQCDERPMLRTWDGRVLATVESWRPDQAN